MGQPSVEGFKSYQECAKQVLAVSSGVMTLTITFWEKIHSPGTGGPILPTPLIQWSWGLFILTDIFALWMLLATTGSLLAFDRAANAQPPKKHDAKVVANGETENIDIPFKGMLGAFVAALACTAFAAR